MKNDKKNPNNQNIITINQFQKETVFYLNDQHLGTVFHLQSKLLFVTGHVGTFVYNNEKYLIHRTGAQKYFILKNDTTLITSQPDKKNSIKFIGQDNKIFIWKQTGFLSLRTPSSVYDVNNKELIKINNDIIGPTLNVIFVTSDIELYLILTIVMCNYIYLELFATSV